MFIWVWPFDTPFTHLIYDACARRHDRLKKHYYHQPYHSTTTSVFYILLIAHFPHLPGEWEDVQGWMGLRTE